MRTPEEIARDPGGYLLDIAERLQVAAYCIQRGARQNPIDWNEVASGVWRLADAAGTFRVVLDAAMPKQEAGREVIGLDIPTGRGFMLPGAKGGSDAP